MAAGLALAEGPITYEANGWNITSTGPAQYGVLPVVGTATVTSAASALSAWPVAEWSAQVPDAFADATGSAVAFDEGGFPVFLFTWANLTASQQAASTLVTELSFSTGSLQLYAGPDLVTFVRCSNETTCEPFVAAARAALTQLVGRSATWTGLVRAGEDELRAAEGSLPLTLDTGDANAWYDDAQEIPALDALASSLAPDAARPDVVGPSFDSAFFAEVDAALSAGRIQAEADYDDLYGRQQTLADRIQRANELHQDQLLAEDARLALLVALGAAGTSVLALVAAVVGFFRGRGTGTRARRSPGKVQVLQPFR